MVTLSYNPSRNRPSPPVEEPDSKQDSAAAAAADAMDEVESESAAVPSPSPAPAPPADDEPLVEEKATPPETPAK